MTITEMFGREAEDVFYLVVGRRILKFALTFVEAPVCPGPCCAAERDGDRWRVDVCANHYQELSSP